MPLNRLALGWSAEVVLAWHFRCHTVDGDLGLEWSLRDGRSLALQCLGQYSLSHPQFWFQAAINLPLEFTDIAQAKTAANLIDCVSGVDLSEITEYVHSIS